MAEDQNAEKADAKKSNPIVRFVILLAIAMLVPAIVGVVTFSFLIKPRLMPAKVDAAPMDDLPPFPEDMQSVIFDEMRVTVQVEDPDLMAPLLIVQVVLSCNNSDTKTLIEAKKEYFAAEILAIHQNRTRAELSDPLVTNSILEQVRMQSNNLLKRLMPGADLSVLKAMYLQNMIIDL